MKIAIDARLLHYRPGGISEYTRQVTTALAEIAPENDYALLHHARSHESYTPASCVRRVNVLTPAHNRLERWTLSAELLRHRFDILHMPEPIPPQRGARRQVVTVQDLHFMLFPEFMTRDSQRYYRNQIEWAVRHADHLLVSSQSTMNDLVRFFQVPANKMTLCMLGVNTAFKPLNAQTLAPYRARLGLPETYILFVGTFEPRKNIPGLLEAYQRLQQDHHDVPPLVLVGRRGWLYEDIFARVTSLDLQEHLIWIEDAAWTDLPAIYSGASVLAAPSHYEGFGLTALEAMACGTPPVVSNRSSLPEVVADAGLLVDPDNPASIADGLARILYDDSLRSELSARGLARAAELSWHNTARIALDTYRAIL